MGGLRILIQGLYINLIVSLVRNVLMDGQVFFLRRYTTDVSLIANYNR